MPDPTNAERQRRWRARRKAGASQQAIANRLGCSRRRVRQLLA